jgi:multisubunit Na+/H+ antiporter MnhB subunit
MRPIVSHLIFGAAGFWLPDITLNAFGAESIWRSTVFPTVGFFIAYQFARAIWKSHSKASVAVFMASGVWLFASTAMMIGASFSGGGFANGFVEAILVILLGLLPPYTLRRKPFGFVDNNLPRFGRAFHIPIRALDFAT